MRKDLQLTLCQIMSSTSRPGLLGEGRSPGISSESGSEEPPSYAVLSDFSKRGQFAPKGQPSKNLKKSQKNLFSMTAPTVPDFIPGSSKTSTTAGGLALGGFRNI